MKTKHEWTYSGLEIRSKNSIIIANVYKHNPLNQTEQEANEIGKLIAAAPELLEALQNLVETVESIMGCSSWEHSKEDKELLTEAKQAIKKATK